MIPKHISILALALLAAAPAFPQLNLNVTPSRTVGHPQTPQLEQNLLYSANPNLVEGREMYQPQGVAVDMTVSPRPIYVSDAGNNRVLAWKDVAAFRSGQAADIVIGQIDLLTTWPQGPNVSPRAPNQGQPLQSGLNNPTGLAARNGDLYVADSGNNRVLRYPKPFTNMDHRPDLVIGQQGLGSSSANAGGLSERTLFLASGSTVFQANIAFDPDGNLWVTDAGNRRVLEYAAKDLTSGGAGLSAILVIGQANFTSARTNLNPNTTGSNFVGDQFAVPSAIAFDQKGRLFVADADPNQPQNFSRVLVFTPPFQNAMSASRIAGLLLNPSTTPDLLQVYSTLMADPEGLFFLADGSMGVVDSLYNRVLIFPPFDSWPPSIFQTSPKATAVLGHGGDFLKLLPNNAPNGATYVPPPSGSVLRRPIGAFFTGTELFIADQGNNRVLAMPLAGSSFGAATRVLGQDRMDTASVNLLEGREFQFVTTDSAGVHVDAGVAIDSTGEQPHLYVADTGNNRVLGFRDLRSLAAGAKADLVIGQQNLTNFQTALCNYPTGDPAAPQAWSLCSPTGLLVDSSGNLWVADRGNARVLRFPKPFTQSGQIQADLVLGQQDFTSKFTDATQSNMGAPYGLAMSFDTQFRANGSLLVSDQNHNRVLVFEPSGGSFQSGQAASKVIGQPDFRSSSPASDLTALRSPHHIAIDTDGRPYVADSGNNRVLIFNSLPQLGQTHPSAALSIPIAGSPEGVYVSPFTGDIWATDTTSGKALRYPRFDQLFVQGSASNFSLSIPSLTLALAQDQFGALAVADASNRVAFYYPRLAAQNAANYVSTDSRALAPGTWTSLYPYAGEFSSSTEAFTDYPLPTVLADTQVLLNGSALGQLSLVSPGQINLYVPMNVQGDFLDVQVIRKSTGRILGAAQIPMAPVAPALFLNPTGQGGNERRLAVVNADDGSVNGPNNPAKRGSYVLLYGTGQGVIPGAPTDGSPAPASPFFRTTGNLRVFVGACYLDEDACKTGDLYYSGLAPGYVGLWQINIRIPQNADPTRPLTVLLMLDSVPSAGALSTVGYNTVIYVQ